MSTFHQNICFELRFTPFLVVLHVIWKTHCWDTALWKLFWVTSVRLTDEHGVVVPLQENCCMSSRWMTILQVLGFFFFCLFCLICFTLRFSLSDPWCHLGFIPVLSLTVVTPFTFVWIWPNCIMNLFELICVLSQWIIINVWTALKQ